MKKIKYIQLPMKFNIALQKFEPELPIKRKGKKVKIKLGWELIVIILGLMLMFGLLFFIMSNSI